METDNTLTVARPAHRHGNNCGVPNRPSEMSKQNVRRRAEIRDGLLKLAIWPNRALCGLILFSVVLLSAEPRLRAQQQPASASYEGQPVGDVILIARPTVSVDALQTLVLQHGGQPYSNDQVQKTVAALQATGQFSKVDVNVTPEENGLRVEFVVEPAFYLGMLYFPGATKVFNYARLLNVVNYPAQEPYEEARVKAGNSALQRFLVHQGYFQAKVDSEIRLDQTRKLATVIYHITLGRRSRFGTIQITGPAPEEIARLEGALRSVRARLRGANLHPGQHYDADRLRAAEDFLQNYLGKQNYLSSQVRLEEPVYDPETNRAALNFQITVGPAVNVQIVGARLSKKAMRSLIPVYEENAVDQDLVDEGNRNLVSHFQSKGFFDAKVTSQLGRQASAVELTYTVSLGNRHRIVEVGFVGNRRIRTAELKNQVTLQKARFFSRGKFSEDLLNASLRNLQTYYRNAGFADVEITPRVVDRDPKVFVTFQISEGVPTLVESIDIEGNRTQRVSTLAPDGLMLKPGQPYSPSRLNQDKNRIVATYLNLGYPEAAFRSTVTPVAGVSHRVVVTYRIEEGPRVTISQVLYVGGRHSRPDFIEHRADIHAGADLSEGKLLAAGTSLYNTGVFDWADVSPRRPITTQTEEDVLVRVHEEKRNSLSYGLGFQITPQNGSISSGVLILPGLPTVGLPPGYTVIQKTKFDPQGSVGYTRLNMLGRAETGSVSALISILDQRGNLSYADPHFEGSTWSAVWSVSAEHTTQNPLYTARVGQASVQFEKALDPGKTKRLQLRYTFNQTSLTNLLIKGFVPPQDESVHLSTTSASFIRDTRDMPLDAHRGIFQTVSFGISPQIFGSSDNVARFFGQTAYYKQVKPWLVWANNFRLGLVWSFGGSHVPFSERYFSGGSDSLRGFPLNGAGPQQEALLCTEPDQPSTCTTKVTVPAGGRQLFIFNSETRFPIPLKSGLGGVFFYDGGNVYDAINLRHLASDYSNTVGFGLRYQTPVGPVRVDVGQNLNPVPGLKRTQWFVTLGQAF
jgi:outer membrane protein insertion porin family